MRCSGVAVVLAVMGLSALVTAGPVKAEAAYKWYEKNKQLSSVEKLEGVVGTLVSNWGNGPAVGSSFWEIECTKNSFKEGELKKEGEIKLVLKVEGCSIFENKEGKEVALSGCTVSTPQTWDLVGDISTNNHATPDGLGFSIEEMGKFELTGSSCAIKGTYDLELGTGGGVPHFMKDKVEHELIITEGSGPEFKHGASEFFETSLSLTISKLKRTNGKEWHAE